MKKSNLLIVDDENSTLVGLAEFFQDKFKVETATSTAEGREILQTGKVDVLVCDLRLGSEDGMRLIDFSLKLEQTPLTILMTAYGSVDTAVEAMKRGAYHFVTKPINLAELQIVIERGLRNRELEERNKNLQSQVDERNALKKLLGKSEPMTRLLELVKQVSRSRATILIEGESGTGKELVAQAIHQLSDRDQDKLITVHCAALSPQLLESELFGHERGSFTGALNRRIGRFEQANGGTLFLDEIAEIDSNTQVKLLRALGERTIERVGGNESIKVDVRVITATNKNLDKMVADGKFREDLYFRLNVVKIQMPTLRERRADIVILANAFLRDFANENRKNVVRISKSAYNKLENYKWPGNVRELKTVVERGVVLTTSNVIDLEHLPEHIVDFNNDDKTSADNNLSENKAEYADMGIMKNLENLNLAENEKKLIKLALEKADNSRTQAAELLGISRRTLQRKLKNSL